jgi:C1A family cysteine protease
LAEHLGKRQLPSAFDWRDYNGHSYIGPIRDQGSCGSCYAFGACAAAEGTYNWANGKYDSNCADFSEAFVAFCLSDHYSGFDGCDGSDYDYDELTALVDYGVCNDAVYPYMDHEQACQSSSWDAPRTTFQSWHRIDCNDIEAIKTAIMTYGVVDASVYATLAFDAYDEGIYQDSNTSCYSSPCYYTPTNHVIALVGWDDNGGDGYWILRNCWGTSWGEGGYMRIKYTSARVACEAAYLVYPAVVSTIYVDPSGSCNGYTPCCSTIQAAIGSAGSGATIKIVQGTYNESFTLNESKSLTLQGGWNSSYTTQTSNTTIIKAPKAPQGSLTLQMLTVRP